MAALQQLFQHQILYFNATDLKLGRSTYCFPALSIWVGHVTHRCKRPILRYDHKTAKK